MNRMLQRRIGVLDRLRRAPTFDDLHAALSDLSRIRSLSNRTFNRGLRIASRRRKQLIDPLLSK